MRLLPLLALLPGCSLFSLSGSGDSSTEPVRQSTPSCATGTVDAYGREGLDDSIRFSFGTNQTFLTSLAANGSLTVYAAGLSTEGGIFTGPEISGKAVPAGLVVRSSNPTVATVAGTIQSGCGVRSALTVTTLTPGTFDLELVDATTDVLYDSLAFDVEQPTSLGLTEVPAANVLVMQGTELTLQAMPMGPNDTVLYGPNAVQFSYDGAFAGVSADGDVVRFVAQGVGPGHVIATSGSLVESAALTSVDTSAIDAIQLSVTQLDPEGEKLWATIEMTALRGGAPVYGAQCDWGTTAVLPPSGGAAEWEPSTTYLLSGSVNGYTATCTIGGVSQTIDLE